MPDFNVRSDSIDVEQIMEQIRARIREKRGVDYTEQQLRELAAVKLEKFLDPRGVRSDLLEQFKQHQPRYEPPSVPSFAFEDTTMFETHRGLLRFFRKLLNPILKLFFNPNAVIHALHAQSEINKANLEREVTRENQRRDMDALYFEVIHNLVFELTRTGIEVKNLKMRVESLVSRLEFNERRARALESVVVYKPSTEERAEPVPSPSPSRPPRSGPSHYPQSAPAGNYPQAAAPEPGVANTPAPALAPATAGGQTEGPGQRSRRRRRRRGRRGGPPASAVMGQPSSSAQSDPSLSLEQALAPASLPSEPRQPAESTPPEAPSNNPDLSSSAGQSGSDPEPQ
jgi:hypothetical protein